MAKKKYDVAERFQEVAKRARETGPIHTGPSGQMTNKDLGVMTRASKELAADPTRPGASMNIPRNKYGEKKDVHLSTGPSKSVAQQVYDAGEEEKKKNPKFKNFGLVKR